MAWATGSGSGLPPFASRLGCEQFLQAAPPTYSMTM